MSSVNVLLFQEKVSTLYLMRNLLSGNLTGRRLCSGLVIFKSPFTSLISLSFLHYSKGNRAKFHLIHFT